MIAKFLLSVFFIAVSVSSVFADMPELTSFTENDSGYTAEFNGIILLHKIKISDTETGKVLSVPYYMKNGYKTNYFSFLDRKFSKSTAENILSKKVSGKSDKKTTYKINSFKTIKNSKSLKAVCGVIFNDMIEANILVFSGKHGPWIGWPSEKGQDGKWKKLFEIKNKELKTKIEAEILDIYSKRTQNK